MRGIWNTIVSGVFFLQWRQFHIKNAFDGGNLILIFAGHYEWHVAWPPKEVDLGAVRARFGGDGTLVIDVPRRAPRSGTRFV